MSPLGRRRRPRPSEAVADNGPIPAGPVDDEEAEALRAAIELRSAGPAADLPRPEFVEGLRRRLGELEGEAPTARVGRRAFLTAAGAGAGAVAAGVAGVVADRTLLQPAHEPAASGPLEPASGAWVQVAGADEVTRRTVSFTTSHVVGFVTERAGCDLVAVSGACSHQGCLLKLNETEKRLDCPCHRTSFSSEGRVLFHQLPAAPSSLARLQVRRNGDAIEVLLPTGQMPQQA
ncbi:MAG TPA: Rieske (2Fe-2S) protein [Acidimicrobiia bacterium]|nr:Rieske (2Fe-2S) protein [Acidimicrobiia bacterium]